MVGINNDMFSGKIAIGTDNACVIVGINNGVFARPITNGTDNACAMMGINNGVFARPTAIATDNSSVMVGINYGVFARPIAIGTDNASVMVRINNAVFARPIAIWTDNATVMEGINNGVFARPIAIGTDNASVMMGINNGMLARPKKEIHHLLLFRGLCYSVQIEVFNASPEYLSINVEFCISGTHKCFLASSMRQLSYKMLHEATNDGTPPQKIPTYCKTRWHYVEPAVGRIISQWIELNTHFDVTRISERCYTAEIWADMYKDKKNLAILLFLHPVLVEVQRVNKLFKARTVDKLKLLDDLTHLMKFIASKLVNPSSRFYRLTSNIEELLDPQQYLGCRFVKKIRDLLDNNILDKRKKD